MTQQQLVFDLKSSRETAKSALNEIYVKISKYKDNDKAKSSLSYNGVHGVCMAIKDNGEHNEIYADAIEKLGPNISAHHWNMFVEVLRYILGEFYKKNFFKRTASLAALVRANRISTPADVKSHLKLYSRQLCYAHMHMGDEEIGVIFQNISGLLVKCTEIQFEDLLIDVHTHILGFPTMLQNVIVKHLARAAPFFDSLFASISVLKIPENTLNDQCLLLTKFLINFIYLDCTDKNATLSQNFLRSCKDNPNIKQHKYRSYAFNLLYYFVKLLLFPNALDFNKRFVEILEKFSAFFDHSELTSESWFMDMLVTMARVLDAFKGQKGILQSMNERSYSEVFALIEKLIKLAHGISYDSGLWTCCNSVRKHIIFKLCMVQLVMFETIVEQSFVKPGLSSCVYTILKHTVAVAEFFKCNTINFEVASILNALMRCAQSVKTKEHGEHLAKMLAAIAKAKPHLPENSAKNLFKCLMHMYKASGNTQGQAEACALHIAYLIEVKADNELIRQYIGMFYSLESCTCILEALNRCTFPLKPVNFSRRLLHTMEVGVFCRMRDCNIVVITSHLKLAETLIDFVLIARQFPQVNVSSKLERKAAELKSKTNPTAVENLALGYISKMRAIQQMDELKNLFNVPKLNDDSLPKISDPGKLKVIDVFSEMQIIKLAFEGVNCFSKFFEVASNEVLPEEDFFVDWESIIDDVAMLARLFHFRGYLDYAYISWRLLLRITTHLNDILNQIRALSFMCDECQFIKLYDPEFKFDEEIKTRETAILECFKNLEFLTPRRQNYVLVCLCFIGWYLAQKKHFPESQLLLDLALAKVDELVERKNKFELVRATHLAVSFRIKWKLQKGMSKRRVFSLVDRLLDEIRAVVYYTSEDALNFPILLFGIINDITEFTTNRLCEPATLPYVQMVLKLALDAGAGYRVVHSLVLWTHINLQSENVAKCQMKLDLIDILFRNVNSSKTKLKGDINNKQGNYLEIGPVEPYRIYGEEAVRKAAYVNPVSPVRVKFTAPLTYRDLGSFLITHESRCVCDKCSHVFLNWQLFKIGCLNARFLYLAGVYNEPNIFYTKAVEWCAKSSRKTHTRFHFKEYELCMLVQYINLLRRTGSFEAALSISEISMRLYKEFMDALDGVYHVNLSLQSESTVAEINRQTIKPRPSIRRLLKFSPSDEQPNTTKRKARSKKESPNTIRENIEDIIYKDPPTTPAVPSTLRAKDGGKSVKRKQKQKPTAKEVEDICKAVEEIKIDEVVPNKPSASVASSRKLGRQMLNTAIIIIEDEDDSPPPPDVVKKPKSAIKVECTPKTRGRSKRVAPSSVAVVKPPEADTRSKLLLRRRI